MNKSQTRHTTIMRLFQVKAKSGCAEQLLQNFGTISADEVQHELGNDGYCFGRGIQHDQDKLIFASFWKDLDAIKQRFGDDWKVSFLPEGYDELIEEYSVSHINIAEGWHVKLSQDISKK